MAALRHPDPQAHEAGCEDNGPGEPCADSASTHVDVFCNCHRYTEPKILSNGTDIAWPAGWAPKQAEAWRQKNGLVRPSEPGAGP
jgi:hypothetical protein